MNKLGNLVWFCCCLLCFLNLGDRESYLLFCFSAKLSIIYPWPRLSTKKCYSDVNDSFFLKQYYFAFIFPCLLHLLFSWSFWFCFLFSYFLTLDTVLHMLYCLFPLQQCGPLQCSNCHLPFSWQPDIFCDGDVCKHLYEIGVNFLLYGIMSTTLLFVISISSFIFPQLFRGFFPLHISLFAYLWLKHQREREYYMSNLYKHIYSERT